MHWAKVSIVSTLIGVFVGLVAAVWSLLTHTYKDLNSHLPCEKIPYTVRIVSYDPFMMHIENFLTAEEVYYLLKLGQPLYKRSRVNHDSGLSVGRTSSTANLPLNDSVAQCIAARAGEIQGFVPVEQIERLQMTRYMQGQQYRAYYDWSPTGDRDNERMSMFFAILKADCQGCGTEFPRLIGNWSARDNQWCTFVECLDGGLAPLTIKTKVGSAFYWRNLLENGTGDERTLHAGLPVVEGSKVGLNIWTRAEPIEW